jgi:hypothetical protein
MSDEQAMWTDKEFQAVLNNVFALIHAPLETAYRRLTADRIVMLTMRVPNYGSPWVATDVTLTTPSRTLFERMFPGPHRLESWDLGLRMMQRPLVVVVFCADSWRLNTIRIGGQKVDA